MVCDGYSGYNALFAGGGVIEVGCMAHARRKFVELHLVNKSTLAVTAIEFIVQLSGIEPLATPAGSSARLSVDVRFRT